ncbi:hypothetical protein [Rhizobium ruizarguesonis]|uniref:hypothetical protein n=1 Tax=Rhizobium ruizarguesonis TaxID=2081791 RepID=UPI0013C03388|nr:hypothetical protein [Rhizobium ruizarguesonis]NEJ02610.1 hypothetical protein [Rhizobium ruizarguesonis]NEJ39738.1 hypothetical protein [Rhizobium ruizarguesonis]
MLQFLKRKRSAMDPGELVALSVLLDKWCRGHGFKHADATTQSAVARMIELRANGGTIEDLKATLSSHYDQPLPPIQRTDLVKQALQQLPNQTGHR